MGGAAPPGLRQRRRSYPGHGLYVQQDVSAQRLPERWARRGQPPHGHADYPPGRHSKVVISKAFIVYTDPSVRYQTTTILGTTIDVEFTPTSYTWNWGDATTTTTTDPGHPYPHQTVTHPYKHTATGVTTTLTTTWTTRYRPTGDTTWHTIEGTITTTETSTPYDLVRITSYLTDDAEEAQGH